MYISYSTVLISIQFGIAKRKLLLMRGITLVVDIATKMICDSFDKVMK